MTDEAINQQASEPLPELMTIDEAARFLRCSPLTVTRKVRRGELPGIKYSRSWMVPRNALLRAINDEAFNTALRRVQDMQNACGDLLRRADHVAIRERRLAAAQQAVVPAPQVPAPESAPQRRGPGRPRRPRTAPTFPYTFDRTE